MHRHVGRAAQLAEANTSGSRTLVDAASRVLVARSTSTCTSESDPGCTKPYSASTMAIAIAVVVPVVGLLVVLLFLHRRHKRKLREEDAKDKYKSLDFGMEPGMGGPKKGKKGAKMGPEMSVSEKGERGTHDRGLSLETGNPYLLPVGLHGSRESFHSLSRSQVDPHDPYRPVTFLNDGQSIHSQSRRNHDNGSMYTTSSAGTERHRMNDGLLNNAQTMSKSYPIRGESLSPDDTKSIKFPEPTASMSPLNPRYENEPLPAPPAPPAASAEPKAEFTAFNPSTVPSIQIPDPAVTNRQVTKSPVQTTPSQSAFPLRVQSQQAIVHENANTASMISTSSYGDGFQVTPPSPRQSQGAQEMLSPTPRHPQGQQNVGLGVDDFGRNSNRLSMSVRPLPTASDDPEENPEQRANRIRSFYKEYFDDSKPEPVGGHAYTENNEDYASEYQDGTFFDARNGNFVVAQPNAPYAEPITRRAMTPPPRAPPRFRSNTGPRAPHMSGSSVASSQYPPRGMSSMSGRMLPPKKALPPPSTLSSLPTPAKLTENSMVFDPIDFAPPVSFRERQNGIRPDSPLGNQRPYSPAVRPHTPLVGSYDDLAVMPSPHALRKSTLFTALDFAPPRFRDPGSNNASDAGSIRSNRSGISAAGRFAVRSGANRVSRIPKGMVGTRDDFMAELRPRMDLVSKG
ncbi:uncharacterized protein K460DRAFT_360680 [Cucurbitaria berberidis CBS 394.84]|uniref:Uncharacterized protein n=1 Tax=Cucurbitaria berberidis CBS 394.84 TaxID=1168544 RepID=A0A9P4GR59_9PLEO|nr:uncharacterized protein K460DRAFT_360680 [Cucurbitaria berberidis CBS 394.84]KAF1849835.1 hypothetical protein K460DRAFT_360680 [Cucurbitaria berberidis CBS 394.84]